jgi:4-carboxymuconolactone decarboxylase
MVNNKSSTRIFLIVVIIIATTMNAQNNTKTTQLLDAPQQSLASISALTATGNLEQLKTQLNVGLDAGLTVNEVKEVLVQLYAYCGFPRSLNAINTFMSVLEERKTKGIADKVGKEATQSPEATDKYEQGRKVLEELTKTPQAKPAPGFGEFAPRIDAFLKEHLFADIFQTDVLTYQQRELVTVSALASMRGVESQLKAHIGMAMNTGLNENQLSEAFAIISQYIGSAEADVAIAALNTVVYSRKH